MTESSIAATAAAGGGVGDGGGPMAERGGSNMNGLDDGDEPKVSAQLLDSARSTGSVSATSDSASGESSASPSRPSSQLSTGRPSVKFASPRTLVINFPSARSDLSDLSAGGSGSNSNNTSAPSSSRLQQPVLSSPSASSPTAHFEHELALQRREFENRFTDFQQQMSADQLHADCTAYRQQVAAMSEQLAVQELFMACQRVELAHFYQLRHKEEQQRLWEMQQAKERARTEAERQEVHQQQHHHGDDQLLSRAGSAVSAASSHSAASEPSAPPSAPSTASQLSKHSSRPVTPSSAASSVSSVLDAAVSARTSVRPTAFASPTASPFGLRPLSSSSSTSASRPTSAGLLSPGRAGSAATSNYSGLTSPFVSSAARPISTVSSSPLSPRLWSGAVSSYPLLSSAASATPSLPSQSSPEPALSDVLAMTESLLAQTDEALQAERVKSDALQATIADMERRATVTSRQYDTDTAEIREQLRIRAAVCSKQEEALHRLTFENHSLVQQIIQMQQQLQQHTQQLQQPTHPVRHVQPSSHHLPAASHAVHSGSARPTAGGRDKSGGLFPPIPSASASTSVTTGRLPKSRFVQPPPAAALATGFSTDSSHASPISTAALGWSQGWKAYTTSSDNDAAIEQQQRQQQDESKEQLSLPAWLGDKTSSSNLPLTRAPLLLFPTLQAHTAAADGWSPGCGDEPQQQLVVDNGEIVIASSPLAATALSAFVPPPNEADAPPSSDIPPPASAASLNLLSAASPSPPISHVHTPTLQLPASPLSPEQLHLHAQFQRPPASSHGDKPPPCVPSSLRHRSAATPASPAAKLPAAADGQLAVHASSFTKGPPAALLRAALRAAGKEGEEVDNGQQSDLQDVTVKAVPRDESEQGWVVEAGGGGPT